MNAKRWTPDRKVWAGGLAGLVSWLLVAVLGLDAEAAGAAGVLAMMLVSYFLPPAVADKVRRADAEIRRLAEAAEQQP